MTVGDWIRQATEQLQRAGISTAKLEAQLLAAHALDRDRSWIAAHEDDLLFNEEQLSSCLLHRLSRFPLAYITGWREFYGRDFSVEPSVLIPRQETETLVLAALEVLPHGAHVLDLGTGSGCVAITLKLERPDLDIVACDISDEAIAIAERWPSAMLFVRCKGGISHHPAESVTADDVALAIDAYSRAVSALDAGK